MNKTIEETIDFANKFNNYAITEQKNIKVIGIAPTFLCLQTAVKNLNTNIKVIAQNVSSNAKGAYTSQISCEMLKSIGVNASLIGHSECRSLLHETDNEISQKLHTLLKNNMTPILCIGESLEDYESNNTLNVLKQQLTALNGIDYEINCGNIIIAYEPV
ncbi:hypothetical protein FACS189496_3100 [Bacilli bacterium]|nr:hypothetical protein FACS189496_3100 [Bacilli bacterium]